MTLAGANITGQVATEQAFQFKKIYTTDPYLIINICIC